MHETDDYSGSSTDAALGWTGREPGSDARALSFIRKESLDIFNRLHSIAEDVEFVNQVHQAYPGLPLLPNLRCGAWYTDPAISASTPAYFKSTDGHFGNWGFNLRRANLHLLPVILKDSGIVLVDSTRSGKRIPDALSKTVPIWCAVINRALLRRFPEINHEQHHDPSWDTALYTPPTSVSTQEHDQISRRLDGWAEALSASSFDLPRLPHPLRPFWITPATSRFPSFPSTSNSSSSSSNAASPGPGPGFLPVICVSASKQVEEGTERRSSGFSYIQGSGDDHELWGMGLNPQIFWDHRGELLAAERARLLDLVASLVLAASSSSSSAPPNSSSSSSSNSAKSRPPATPIAKVGNRISITTLSSVPTGILRDPPSPSSHDSHESHPQAYVLLIPEPAADSSSPKPADPNLQLQFPPPQDQHAAPPKDVDALVASFTLPPGKKAQQSFLQAVLPSSLQFIGSKLGEGYDVCVACESGRDLSVGVALAAISSFFDDAGAYNGGNNNNRTNLDKRAIRTRLEWIIASRPEANPSRATLKRVNEYLLTADHFRR